MSNEIQIHQLAIEGMTCSSCALRIEKVLKKDPANQEVAVSFPSKSASIKSSKSRDAVKAAIEAIGYAVVEVKGEEELEKRELDHIKTAKKHLITAAILTLPIFAISMLGFSFPGSGYVEWLLATLVLVGPGRGFFSKAWKLAKKRESSMDTLVSLGTVSAYIYSVYLLLNGQHHFYFETAAVIITLILLGKFLEERARQSISAAIRSLMKLQPKEASLLSLPHESTRSERRVPIHQIPVGAKIMVRPGDRVPVDGKVLEGVSAIDESMLTGESLPVDVAIGQSVIAGTVNLSSPIVVEAVSVGAKTELARMIAMVETAQSTKAPIQKLADKAAGYFVPAALAMALFTFIGWMFAGQSLEYALTAAIAVLVVACPCALGLATPTAIMVGTGRAAKMGILFRDAPSLQTLHKANAVVFDKTGTLTIGKPVVREMILLSSFQEAEVLDLAWRLEVGSNHPLARAIKEFAEQRIGKPDQYLRLVEMREIPGSGVRAVHGQTGEEIRIGHLDVMSDREGYKKALAELAAKETSGGTVVAIAKGPKLMGLFLLQDQLRQEARESVSALKKMGLRLIMATGDHEAAAKSVAQELAIEYRARQKPEEKLALVQELKNAGLTVAMAGDGINDAPALAGADVGIAMGGGTDAAIHASGVTLRDNSIRSIADAISLSRKTFANIKQNLFWAFIYNILLIPMAAWGELSPMLAAGAMALSSLFVVGNAVRLQFVRID